MYEYVTGILPPKRLEATTSDDAQEKINCGSMCLLNINMDLNGFFPAIKGEEILLI